MTASIWNPNGTSTNTANADNNYKHQVFIVDASIASTGIFPLTAFAYQIGTESLLVLVNGVDQVLTTDYTETNNTTVTIPGVEIGDEVVIRALVGSIASQTAAVSASQAAIDAAAAHQAYLDTLALTPVSLPLPVAQGGTGNTTASTGFAALAPVLSGTAADANKVIGTTDGINYSLIPSSSNSVMTPITGTVTLTNLTIGYHKIAMTAANQVISLPDATTLSTGYSKAIFDNSKGTLTALLRDAAGNLISVISAGGTATLGLSDNSTAAGIWDAFGTNLDPGAVTFDTTLSATYTGASIPVFVALDTNTSVHFVVLAAGGFAALVVDNLGKVISTPVTVSVTVSEVPCAAFKVTGTTLLLFYGVGTTTHKCIVLTLTSASPTFNLSLGTPQSLVATMGAAWEGEDSVGAPKIVQLTATQYIAPVIAGTNTGAVSVSVAGTVITIGAIVNVLTTNAVLGTSNLYSLTATTAIMFYKITPSAFVSKAVVVTVTAGVISFGAAITVTGVNSTDGVSPAATCAVSATVFMIAGDASGVDTNLNIVTVVGTVCTAGTLLVIETGTGVNLTYTSDNTSRYNPKLILAAAGGTNYVRFLFVSSPKCNKITMISETAGALVKGLTLSTNLANGNFSRGLVYPQSGTGYLEISTEATSTIPNNLTFDCGSSAALVLTPGQSYRATEGPISGQVIGELGYTLLSSGNNLWRSFSSVNGTGTGYMVIKTAGLHINYRGTIKTPKYRNTTQYTNAVAAQRAVAILSPDATFNGTISQARIVNMEVAL